MVQRPRPVVTDENRPFWEAARAGEFRLQCCDRCDRVWFPIGPVCPDCLSPAYSWKQLSGRGQVSSWVVFHKAFFPYFQDQLPYIVVQVELEEGPRYTANLQGADLDSVRIGMPVAVTFEAVDAELTLPQFRPAEDEALINIGSGTG